MNIAWRGQHQFSLITAVSQPGRETERGASQFLFCTERITVIAIAQRLVERRNDERKCVSQTSNRMD
ncbi:MAG: hypothetical protein ACYTXT_22155 [Nostoc sp.]